MPKEIMSRLRTMCPCFGPIFNRRKGEYSFGPDRNDSSKTRDTGDEAVFVRSQHNRIETDPSSLARTERGTVTRLNISDIQDATVDLDNTPQLNSHNLNDNPAAQVELNSRDVSDKLVEDAKAVESASENEKEESFVKLQEQVTTFKEGRNTNFSEAIQVKGQVTTDTINEAHVDGQNRLQDGIQTAKTQFNEIREDVKEQKEKLTPDTVQSRLEQQLEAAQRETESEDKERVIVGRKKHQTDGEEVKEELVVVERAAGLHAFGPGFSSERTRGSEIEPRPDIETMDDITDVFKEISDGKSEIDAYQLQSVLNNCFTQEFEFEGFSDDLCRSMVAMHDEDLSGRLSYPEFRELWEDLQQWKEQYTAHDADNNGYFDKAEFADVLEQIGMTVGDDILPALTIRFSDREGHVRFNDFVACAVKLKIAITTFQQNAEGEDTADFTADQFIQLGMYS